MPNKSLLDPKLHIVRSLVNNSELAKLQPSPDRRHRLRHQKIAITKANKHCPRRAVGTKIVGIIDLSLPFLFLAKASSGVRRINPT